MCDDAYVTIAVYTSITNAKDSLKAPLDTSEADFILFCDQVPPLHDEAAVSCWEQRAAPMLFADPRRNSRVPKLLAHQFLAEYDYSLWLDGSMRLLVPARQIVETYLGDADIALFCHTTRECIYDEAVVCTNLRLDEPAIIEAQMSKYRLEGFPTKQGLYECGAILRRHSSLMESFNNAWWSEYCRHSCRDQLSFNYVLRKLGLRATALPGTVLDNPGIISFEDHLRH
jgi:hypothetical protein